MVPRLLLERTTTVGFLDFLMVPKNSHGFPWVPVVIHPEKYSGLKNQNLRIEYFSFRHVGGAVVKFRAFQLLKDKIQNQYC